MTEPVDWDGSREGLAELARLVLRLPPNDPDMPRLTRVAGAVVDAISNFLDAPAGQTPLPDPVPDAITEPAVLGTVDGYRRKDAALNVTGVWSEGGDLQVRPGRDWLGALYWALRPYRLRFGVA